MKSIIIASVLALAGADLRMASQPKNNWVTLQYSHEHPFVAPFAVYMEPSDFNYAGLKQQRDGGGYDNFLRSNIDNEQDRRNFNEEDGKDHLPFRSYETAATDIASGATVERKLQPASSPEAFDWTEAGDHIFAKPGEPVNVPLRWNNPHASELELNIWIMNKEKPYVIPVKKPSCDGEGYQNTALTFIVPANFNEIASCSKVGECVLQIYAHSVESRMYSMGTPIIVDGGTGLWKPGEIKPAEKDTALDLTKLRRLCLPSSDPAEEANHKNAVVYEARLSSDVYNHAYQNSDFSPYAGQQPQFISQNMQASCILKMTVGNFGELGKEYMQKTAPEARQYAKKLDKKAEKLIRIYETTTNAIIEATKEMVKSQDILASVAAPSESFTECKNWTDYNGNVRVASGGLGGFCKKGLTCLCEDNCRSPKYAYCGLMVDGENKKVTFKEGTKEPRSPRAAQRTQLCFRCAETGSVNSNRQNTNTYIPSFELRGRDVVNIALEYVAPIHLKSGFLTHPDTGAITKKTDDKAILQIYMAVLTEMWPEFKNASTGAYLEEYNRDAYNDPEKKKKYLFTYRGPVLKDTKTTLSDANGGIDQHYRKIDEDGKDDRGYYSSSKAWKRQDRGSGSSTAIPDRKGPIFEEQVISSYNMAKYVSSEAAPKPSGGSSTVRFPPEEIVAGQCGELKMGSRLSAQITEQGVDMDGLDADANCDEDTYVQKLNNMHDEACDKKASTDKSYECPPYPDPECIIPGKGGILPGQLFTNDGPEYGAVASAATALPSAAAIAFAAFMMF